MNDIPNIKRKRIPDARLAFLKDWLTERAMDLETRALDLSEDAGQASEAPSSTVKPDVAPLCNEPLRIGQVRLLHPSLIPDLLEPVYVAVYSEWRPLGVLIAPFSRYDSPAFDGELRIQRDDSALRTLCVWNSYSLPTMGLKNSWLVGYLNQTDCSRARAVFRAHNLGEELSLELQKLTGSEITKVNDPRLDYQREETERLASLCRLQETIEALQEPVRKVIRDVDNLILFPVNFGSAKEADQNTLPVAASSRPQADPLPRKTFEIEGSDLQILVNLSTDRKYVDFLITDSSGSPTNSLDGAQVDSTEFGAAIFSQGRARLPVSGADMHFVLFLPDGTSLILSERSEPPVDP